MTLGWPQGASEEPFGRMERWAILQFLSQKGHLNADIESGYCETLQGTARLQVLFNKEGTPSGELQLPILLSEITGLPAGC